MFSDQGRVIASITMRATMGRKRALLFAIPAVILLLVTVLLKLAHPHDPTWPSQVDGIFGFTVVLPLTALIIGTSVLGAEADDGSIVHLLATPVPRSVVIWSKYLVAVVLTAAYILWTVQRVFLGTNPAYKDYPDINLRELLCIVPLLVLAVALGVLPSLLLLNWMEPHVTGLVEALAQLGRR